MEKKKKKKKEKNGKKKKRKKKILDITYPLIRCDSYSYEDKVHSTIGFL
jgi:hypothetical protein